MAKWMGAKYLRVKSKTIRDANTGAVFSRSGKFLGVEEINKHYSGDDPTKRKLKKGKKQPKFRKVNF